MCTRDRCAFPQCSKRDEIPISGERGDIIGDQSYHNRPEEGLDCYHMDEIARVRDGNPELARWAI